MATKTFGGARPLVIRQSAARPIIKVSAPRPLVARAKKAAGFVASRAAQVAREEKHRITAIAAAGFLGYAEKNGWNLPQIDALGAAGTYGLGIWLAQKSGFVRSRTLSHLATGFLCVAAYQFGNGQSPMSGVMIGGR